MDKFQIIFLPRSLAWLALTLPDLVANATMKHPIAVVRAGWTDSCGRAKIETMERQHIDEINQNEKRCGMSVAQRMPL